MPFDGFLHVIYGDDGDPMIADETPDTADALCVTDDRPTPERVAAVLAGGVPVYEWLVEEKVR